MTQDYWNGKAAVITGGARGQGAALHPQGGSAPLTRLWLDDERGGSRGFVLGVRPPADSEKAG